MQTLNGKRVLVIGLGVSGRSAVRFLLRRGASVHAVDGNRDLLQNNLEVRELIGLGVDLAHDLDAIDITVFDLVVVSPGIPHVHPLYSRAQAEGIEVIGEVELACRFLKGTFLGITGTNGKTTVTLLVEHVLNNSGIPARALGNSGVPLTYENADDIISGKAVNSVIVAELSSFQLETMHSPIIDAAVLLNITPDHLDRYHSMDEYALSKWHIADCLKSHGVFYAEQNCWQEFGHLLKAKNIKLKTKIYGYTSECDLSTDLFHLITNKKIECVLPSRYQAKISHDLENIMAAFALCHYVGVTSEQFFAALATFKKPAHRIEFVRKHNEVSYFDDSKGTNIDAVIRAVSAMQGDIILIAGGVDKGAAYTPWIEVFANRVKMICAIGQAAQKIKQDLAHAVPVELFRSLDDAVDHAARLAEPGDNVLLSPGCSSFDMFRDYAHRGEEFQRIVKQLGI